VTIRLESHAAIGHVEALNGVQSIGVRCFELVDDGSGIDRDRIDHQRIAVVMANRFAGPLSRRSMRRSRAAFFRTTVVMESVKPILHRCLL